MFVYEKKVDDERHLFGTLDKVASDEDSRVTYKDDQGNVLEDVKFDDLFVDAGEHQMRRVSDNKLVELWIDDTNVIPGGKEAPVPPEPAKLVSIEVKTPPTKVEYFVDEQLELDGIEILATYDDDTTKIVTEDCVFNPADGDTLTEDVQKITISFTDDDITKDTVCDITVSPVVVEEDDESTED